MSADDSLQFQALNDAHNHEVYVLLERLSYHLTNLADQDGRITTTVDAEYEYAALVDVVTQIFENFDVSDEDVLSCLEQSLSRNDSSSRDGIVVELYLSHNADKLRVESTELVTQCDVLNVRQDKKTSSKAKSAFSDFSEEITGIRGERVYVQIQIQRKHDRVRFGWTVSDIPPNVKLSKRPFERLKNAIL